MNNVKFHLIPDFLYIETSDDGEGNYSLDYYNMKPSLFITRKDDEKIVIMKHSSPSGYDIYPGYYFYDEATNTCSAGGDVSVVSDPETDTWKLS